MAETPSHSNLPPVKRFITTHDASGKPTFETGVNETLEWDRAPAIGADLSLCYGNEGFPVPLTNDVDLNQYKNFLVNKPAFMIKDGTVLRYVDFYPGQEPQWHRTVTLDFGVVIEGELELVLEGGEKRIMRPGDVAVQRGTNHSWRNPSKDKFARGLFVALDAKPVVVNGKDLGESLGNVEGH